MFTAVVVGNIDRKNREEHHSHHGQNYADNLSYGRYGENLRADGRYIHPRPPQRIAKVIKAAIYAHFAVVEEQCGDIGKHYHREDISCHKSSFSPIYKPFQNNHGRHNRYYHRRKGNNSLCSAIQPNPAPVQYINIRYREGGKEQIPKPMITTILGNEQPKYCRYKKYRADHKLQHPIPLREQIICPIGNLNRNRDKQNNTRRQRHRIKHICSSIYRTFSHYHNYFSINR